MKKNRSQAILIMSVFTLTIASLWVYLSIHQALGKTEKPVLNPQQTKVLSPILDETVFEELKKRNI